MPSVGFTVLKFEVCKANGSAALDLRSKLRSRSRRKVAGDGSLAVRDDRVNGRGGDHDVVHPNGDRLALQALGRLCKLLCAFIGKRQGDRIVVAAGGGVLLHDRLCLGHVAAFQNNCIGRSARRCLVNRVALAVHGLGLV